LFCFCKRTRQRQNQSSRLELNSSSTNSSKKVVPVIVTRLFGKPNETVRDVKRGSGTDLEPIVSATIAGLTRAPRNPYETRGPHPPEGCVGTRRLPRHGELQARHLGHLGSKKKLSALSALLKSAAISGLVEWRR
jgi:hypothetical protein